MFACTAERRSVRQTAPPFCSSCLSSSVYHYRYFDRANKTASLILTALVLNTFSAKLLGSKVLTFLRFLFLILKFLGP